MCIHIAGLHAVTKRFQKSNTSFIKAELNHSISQKLSWYSKMEVAVKLLRNLLTAKWKSHGKL